MKLFYKLVSMFFIFGSFFGLFGYMRRLGGGTAEIDIDDLVTSVGIIILVVTEMAYKHDKEVGVMKWLIAKLILYPLVYRNYRLRQEGKRPDEWYWADIKLMKWGFMERDESAFWIIHGGFRLTHSQHTVRRRK